MDLQSSIVSEGTLPIALTALVILFTLWKGVIRRVRFVQWDRVTGTLRVLLDRKRRRKKGSRAARGR
jgi:hypothetical protein